MDWVRSAFLLQINVQEVLPDAGSTTYKDMLAVLALFLCWCDLSFCSMIMT